MVYICGVTSRQRLGKYHENLNISLNHSLMPSPTPKTQIPSILAINRGQKDIEPPPAAPPHTKTTEPLPNIRVKSPKKSCSPHICPIWTPCPQKRCREAGRLQPLPEVNLAPLKPLPAVRPMGDYFGVPWEIFPPLSFLGHLYAPLFEHWSFDI